MLFDKYAKKAIKIVKIGNFFLKNKLAFIISGASIITASTSFLLTKGIVFDNVDKIENITYGENVSYQANALFGKIEYEFSKVGSDEWTLEEPYLVGDYKVRAVSKDILNNERYGDEYTFSIEPKKIDLIVKEQKIIYGEYPTLVGEFAYSDNVTSFDFEYANLATENVQINLVDESIVIKDKMNTDVTYCYDISTKVADVELEKRKIELTVNGGTKTYDGTPLLVKEYKLTNGNLVKEDSLVVVFNKSLIDVGKVSNDSEVIILSSEGVDTTKYYDISYIIGDLEVTGRPLLIETGSLDIVYDGKVHSNTNYIIDESTSLVEGHFTSLNSYSTIKNCGVKENILDVLISDEEGNDVTSNYAISYLVGELSVGQRLINIQTSSDGKIYDGKEFFNNSYIINSETLLIEGHTIEVNENTKITNAGEFENILSFKIFDEEEDVTSNYSFDIEFGTLNILKREIKVLSNDATWVYDGTNKKEEGFTIVSSVGLADNENIVISSSSVIKNVGKINNIQDYIIKNGEEDVTSNYSIIKEVGELSVTPRYITIETLDVSRQYDGSELINHDVVITSGELAPNQVVEPTMNKSIVNVGSIINDFTYIIKDSEEETTSNYIVETHYGKLIVTKRIIEVTSRSASKEYDGLELKELEFDVTSNNKLVLNHYIEVITSSSIISVGEIDNILKYKITNGTSENIEANYHIEYKYGKLKITQRVIEILTGSSKKEYDSTPLTCFDYKITSINKLIGNDRLEIIKYSSIVDISLVDNILEFDVKDENNNSVISNYKLVVTYGKLNVVLKTINVNTLSKTYTYNDCDYSYAYYEVDPEHDIEIIGHELTLEKFTIVREAGKYDNVLKFKVKCGELDVSHYYDIIVNYGQIVIDPIKVNVKTYGDEKVYDGTELTNSNYVAEIEKILGHHQLELNVVGTITNKGEIKNNFDAKVEDKNTGRVVTNNYQFIADYGMLVITPREITITTKSASKIYDGTPLFNYDCSLTTGSIASNQTIEMTVNESITNVGSIINKATYVIKDLNNNDVTSNYLVTEDFGTLEITYRKITISTNSVSKVYDGTPLFDYACIISSGSVAPNQTIEMTVNESITNVGSIINKATYVIKDLNNNDVTSNYLVTEDFGTLEITYRKITITSYSNSKIYDATPLTCDLYEITSGSIAPNQTINVEITGTITDKGIAPNIFTYSIKDAGGNEVSSNYEVTKEEGKLEVIARDLHIYTDSDSKVYDKKPLTNKNMYYIEEDVLSIHSFEYEIIGTITNVGTTKNDIIFDIYDQNHNSVLHNYNPIIEYGILEITPIILKYQTGSSTKEYDGKPLINKYLGHISGEVLEGHTIDIYTVGIIVDVGEEKNTVEYTILDENKQDISFNYYLDIRYGILKITLIEIIIQTGSASKLYDGTPLFNDEIRFSSNKLIEGHHAVYQITGEQTQLGSSRNKVEFFVHDSNNNDVTDDYYTLTFRLGVLKVHDGSQDDYNDNNYGDNDSGGGSSSSSLELDISGNLSMKGNGSGGGNQVVLRVTASTTGSLYYRIMSYGDYYFTSWDNTPKYFDSYDAITNPIYLTARGLENAGYPISNVEIEYESSSLQYVTPYFVTNGIEYMPNDYMINPVRNTERVQLEYISYHYSSGDNISLVGTKYEELEKEYSQFVHENYLSLPESTREGMLELAYQNNLFEDSDTLIEDVASYIKNAAKYNLDFAQYPEGCDQALYFLTQAKEGVCQQYATAAVCMYRALGLPARYTIGFASYVYAGEQIEVTPETFHAWVEVYIDGLGWVDIEVTGSGENNNREPELGEEIITLPIRPQEVKKEYDGTPLYPNNVVTCKENIFEKLLNNGYYYTVSVSGERTEIGTSKSEILDFHMFDKDGNNVDEYFKYVYQNGNITITKPIVKLTIESKVKEYDGTPLIYTNDDCTITCPEGLYVDYQLSGIITEIGELIGNINKKDVHIYDSEGFEVTNEYELVIEKGRLTITPINLNLITPSASKEYDGTPLEKNEYQFSGEKLMDGHTANISVENSITEIGKIINDAEITIVDEFGNDVSEYYSVNEQFGYLEITPTVLEYTTGSAEKTYDGTPLTNSEYEHLSGKLLDGHTINFETIGTITDVGEVNNEAKFTILDRDNVDVSHLYKVSIQYGILVVNPVHLMITTGSASKEYDGTPLEKDEYELTKGDIANSQKIIVDVNGSITDVGKVDNTANAFVYDERNNNVTHNYNIEFDYGELIVTKRNIEITTSSASKEYDGTPLEKKEYQVTSGTLAEANIYNIEVLGSIVDIGEIINDINISITDLQGNDVMDYYNISYNLGKLTVTPIILTYETGPGEKTYDGTPLTNSKINFISGNILEGHSIEAKAIGSITYAGEILNDVEFIVKDSENNDVTHYYALNFDKFGKLKINPISINVSTGSAEKTYDGTPLYCDEIKFDSSNLVSSDKVVYQITGKQIDPGESPNYVDFYVYNYNNEDVTHCYLIKFDYGKLVVKQKESDSNQGGSGGSGGSGAAGNIDLSGKISSENFAGDGGNGKPQVMFKVTSTNTGLTYFKAMSFGDYNLSSWDNNPKSYYSTNALTNPQYLTSRALQNNNFKIDEMEIEYVVDTLAYLTPYYATNGVENLPYDYIINPTRTGNTVNFEYISYKYSSNHSFSNENSNYELLEKEYSDFVYANYLSLPDSTRIGMQKIADENNLFNSSDTIIADVATYIQSAAVYNMKFKPFPENADIALYFLTESKEGICQHYATAAVCMYRTLGIPARYTVGFTGNTVSGTQVDVTSETAHAWVEVYIDGLGWVNVEVTGSGAPNFEGSGGSISEGTKDKQTIVVKPIDVDKEYDGTPLYAVNEIDISGNDIESLIQFGYYWDVVCKGEQTELGESESEIVSFTLYDYLGKNVTSEFDIVYSKGKVMVTKEQILFYIISDSKVYDGTALSYSNDDCIVICREGLNVNFTLSGSITNPGVLKGNINKKNISVTDDKGINVTSEYYLKIIEGELKIHKCPLQITSTNQEKNYDGTPLESKSYWISMGELMEGHILEVEITGSITDVGQTKNTIESIKVLDEEGNDVSFYYEIQENEGTLTIK